MKKKEVINFGRNNQNIIATHCWGHNVTAKTHKEVIILDYKNFLRHSSIYHPLQSD